MEKEGELLPLPPRSQRRILMIGDSISCGYGNEATRDEGNPPDKENGYMTYGGHRRSQTGSRGPDRGLVRAEALPEQHDGRGLRPDPGDGRHPQGRPDGLGARRGADRSGHQRFREQRRACPKRRAGSSAYKAFIKTIRKTAPTAYIFVASGPMGTAAEWDKWAKTVVADLNRAGDKNVAYLPFPTQDINGDGIGGHWHPNLKTHAQKWLIG